MEPVAYEPGRLRRAAQLAVRQLGPRQFRVRGQDEPYYDVDLDGDPVCYCADSQHRNVRCKHELAAALASGDPALLNALGDMLLKAHQRAAELERQSAALERQITRGRKAS